MTGSRAARAVFASALALASCAAVARAEPPASPAPPPPSSAPAVGSPEAKAAAQAHLDRGNALFTDERYGEALAELEKAFALYPSPRLEFNMGQCERALGHGAAASAHFQRFLDGAGDVAPALRAEAERYLAELSAAERAPPPPPPAMPPPAAVTAPVPAAPAPRSLVEADAAERRPLVRRWWVWAVAGAVVVAAGASVAVALLAPRDPDCPQGVSCF